MRFREFLNTFTISSPLFEGTTVKYQDALDLMHEYTENVALRKHMYAVEGAMRAYAKKLGEDEGSELSSA